MTTPSERIYEDAAAIGKAAGIEQLADAKGPDVQGVIVALVACQVDAIVHELDREAKRRAEWETLVEMRLHDISEHPALSVPPLVKFEIADAGPGRYDFEEESDE